MFATEVIPSKCLEYGTNCPPPLNGYICIDSPGYCDIVDKTFGNISPLYQLDIRLVGVIIYFGILRCWRFTACIA